MSLLKIRTAALVVTLGVVGTLTTAGVGNALPATGPVPAPSNTVALSASPVTNVADGSTVTFTVTTSGATKLVGSITAHLCRHGSTSYSNGTFGYDDQVSSRCVFADNIVSGGLASSDYEKVYGPYAGTESNSGALTFNVGHGSVTWGNNGGYGPFSLQADSANPVDLVLQVNLTGDANTSTTYFIQPITFAAASNAIGSCTGQVGLVTYSNGTGGGLSDATQVNVTAKGKLLKDVSTKTAIGGSCTAPARTGDPNISPPVGALTIKSLAVSLLGNASCGASPAGPNASKAWPLSGKVTYTANQTYVETSSGKTKPYQIQAAISVLGKDAAGPDVLDIGGIVLKGLAVGARVSGSLWLDPVTKATGTTGYNTGYALDLTNAASCADATLNNASVTTSLFGGGAGSSQSLVGSTAAGLSFSLGS